MARIKEEELKAQIKSGEFSNVYFIYGEETYLKEHYVKKLKDKLVDPAFEDFNFHQYEGRDSALSDILQDADMIPMMSEHSMVLVHDFPFDKQSDVDDIKEFFKDVPDSSVLVFWYDSISVDFKKQKKWTGIEKAFASAGSSVELSKKTEGELAKLIMAYAKKRKCTIDSATARYLIAVVGNDLKTIFNELEKLCSYVSESEITKKDIDSVAVKCLSARVYDLSKFITKGDSDNAYKVLNTLFEQKEDPIEISSVISSCYIDMYRAKCVNSANVPPSDLKEYFNYRNRDFVINNAVRDSRNISFSNLRDAIDILAQSDEKLKSTAIDKRLVLEEAVAKLLCLREM